MMHAAFVCVLGLFVDERAWRARIMWGWGQCPCAHSLQWIALFFSFQGWMKNFTLFRAWILTNKYVVYCDYDEAHQDCHVQDRVLYTVIEKRSADPNRCITGALPVGE